MPARRPGAVPGTLVLLALCLCRPAFAEDVRLDALNQRGISMALAQNPARAESSFVALLSLHRGDARATNNLGNLSLLKGELMVALSFYDRALRSDSTDAGVRLNRATVFLLMGEEPRALEAAAQAVQMAGGPERAGALLGLREVASDSTRAAEKKWLTKAELRALLRKASSQVPAATAKPKPDPNAERGQGKRTPNWRSGATRASDDADAASVLYWKR